jgi:quercetin dioxygenase-like cupin family protein
MTTDSAQLSPSAIPTVSGTEKIKTQRMSVDGVDILAQYVPKLIKITTQPLPKNRVVVLSQGAVLFEAGDQKLNIRAPNHFLLNANTVYCMTTLEDSIWYGIGSDETASVLLTKQQAQPEHFFSQGLYAKKMTIPAGTQIPTHRHVYDHLSILAQGRVRVTVGAITQEHVAPSMIEIKKELAHNIQAIEDSVWFCVHATEETEVDKIDQTLILEK